MQQIITDVGTDVGKFMEDFSTNYIIALINRKMQDIMSGAVDKITPNFLADSDGGDDGGDDANDGVEEKKEEDKSDDAPIAAGVSLIGHRIGYGPDRQYHRYYDFAIWAIKPQDSVISKTVRRHKPILDWFNTLKRQVAEAPEFEFPKKKLFNKNVEYYTNRFITMRNYFRSITPSQKVSTSEYFLKFWGLQYDEKEAAQREIFFAALEATCASSGIDWNNARWRAQEIGLDLDETEMLKVVAVEKVGEVATQKIRDQVYALSYVPGPVKGKFISSTEAKLAGMIATTVENAWNAVQEKFKELAIKLNELLDKGCEPVQKLIDAALDPIGKLVKQKIDALDDKMNVDDGLDREVKATRFPPLAAAWQAAQNKKFSEIVKPLIESINKMSDCYKYVGYLRYNLGDPEIGQYVPYLDQIQENHYRLTIALTDIAYVLSRAGVNAFEPLLKYVDKVTDNGFDEKTHAEEIQIAVREGGRRLAIDFFSLPQTVDRACWYCGSASQKTVMKVGETTTWALADLLGTVATTWKPTSKDDARPKLLEALKEPLDGFISERVKTFVSAVRISTANLVGKQLLSIIGSGIDDVAQTLNDLCSAIPAPIGDKIKPGDIVKYLVEKMATNLVTLGVKLIAKKTESIMYSENGVADSVDENLVWRYRWAPRLRDYDDDNAEPEGDATKKTEADKGDNAEKTEKTEKNETNENNADTNQQASDANGGGDDD